MMKQCSRCRESKPLAEFNKEKRSSDGRRYSCRFCDHKQMLNYLERLGTAGRHERRHKATLARQKFPEKQRAYSAKYRLNHYAEELIHHAKKRARKRGLQFDLDEHLDEIKERVDVVRCELTGLPLTVKSGRAWDRPSLDRIVPEKGYLYTNIRVVCHAINCALGNWGSEIMMKVSLAYMKQHTVNGW